MHTWSADLAGLLGQLGIDRCHVHGGSVGSFNAIDFAATTPNESYNLDLGAGAIVSFLES